MNRCLPQFTADQIASACGGRMHSGMGGLSVAGICTDTRELRDGQGFVALIGENHDGHDFLPEAISKGASVLVVENGRVPSELPSGVEAVEVADTTRALMDLAGWHRGRLCGRVLAITGSCGKSTVKTMLSAILRRTGACCGAPRSFNNRIGVSLTLLQARVEDDFVVLELGTNHPGEIDELAELSRPHAGCITCIGECHLEGLGDREGVREAKAELIPHISPDGLLVLNEDDDYCRSLAERYDGQVCTFGFGESADLRSRIPRDSASNEFRVDGRTYHLPVPGRHNVMNAMSAMAMARWAGASELDIAEGLAGVELPDMRFERRKIAGTTYVLDCYNSNPPAMRAAAETFQKEEVAGRRIVVSGDMLELGDAACEMHREIGNYLASAGIDLLVAVGKFAECMVQGWHESAGDHQRALRLPSAEEAWTFVWELACPGDAVLLKGSRKTELEQIPRAIAERAEERRQGEAA